MRVGAGPPASPLGRASASTGEPRLPRLRRRLISAVAVLAVLSLLGTAPVQAREADFRRFPDYLWLLLGAGMGLVVHESGHLLFDAALGTDPTLVGVKL